MFNVPFYPEAIPIVFAANKKYVPYMSAMIQSVMENASQNRKYVFYILHKEITCETIALLKTQISFFPQFSIEFIDVTTYISKYNLFISRHITVEAYFRLLIPELLCEYQKAIYLDSDMICCTDIAELFDINLENYLIAAVRGIRAIYAIKEMGGVGVNFKNINEYFNSGVCVFNIDLFGKTISSEKIFEIASSREWNFHDQDVLNCIAEGKTLLLPYSWNYISTAYKKYFSEALQNEYDKAEKDPKIIHYKPWDCGNYILHFELFWKYATRTPFIDDIMERMKVNKFTTESFKETVISYIKQRKDIGIRFILFDCVRAWLFRDKRK